MNYLISISYDGSKFYGFQRLNNNKTVQKTIEEALTKINKSPVTIKGAGRTDRGVHALDQKASFKLNFEIDSSRLKEAINSLVKPYIYIKKVEKVSDDFHARFSVVKKEYIYKINLGPYNPIFNDYMLQTNSKLNIKLMKKCAKIFIGPHNFKNFVSGTRTNYNCIIYSIKFKKRGSVLEIKFTGKSFYRYMIRNLVGAMLDINKTGNINSLKEALLFPEVKKQFSTAAPEGLYLTKIYY